MLQETKSADIIVGWRVDQQQMQRKHGANETRRTSKSILKQKKHQSKNAH